MKSKKLTYESPEMETYMIVPGDILTLSGGEQEPGEIEGTYDDIFNGLSI